MLGLINILFLVENYPLTMKQTFTYIKNDFALKMFELTSTIIKLTRNGKAFPIYNKMKNVLRTQAELVGVIFFKQMSEYIRNKYDI